MPSHDAAFLSALSLDPNHLRDPFKKRTTLQVPPSHELWQGSLASRSSPNLHTAGEGCPPNKDPGIPLSGGPPELAAWSETICHRCVPSAGPRQTAWVTGCPGPLLRIAETTCDPTPANTWYDAWKPATPGVRAVRQSATL